MDKSKDIYYQKYLKYKAKYHHLKKLIDEQEQKGGMLAYTPTRIVSTSRRDRDRDRDSRRVDDLLDKAKESRVKLDSALAGARDSIKSTAGANGNEDNKKKIDEWVTANNSHNDNIVDVIKEINERVNDIEDRGVGRTSAGLGGVVGVAPRGFYGRAPFVGGNVTGNVDQALSATSEELIGGGNCDGNEKHCDEAGHGDHDDEAGHGDHDDEAGHGDHDDDQRGGGDCDPTVKGSCDGDNQKIEDKQGKPCERKSVYHY